MNHSLASVRSRWVSRACALVVGLAALGAAGRALGHDGHALKFEAAASESVLAAADTAGPARWWKGNTHTHSWWSDGSAPPEWIASWYRDKGYNFLVFSDHNRMQSGLAWREIATEPDREALAAYVERFGAEWVEQRTRDDGVIEVKLKTLDEFRTLVERPGQFALIRGEEVTDRFFEHPVHVNAVNVDSLILPQGGESVAAIINNTVKAVAEHGRRSGRPVFAHLNHPNFYYAITAEDLIAAEHDAGEGFLEIYNGHAAARNEGNASRPSVERMWDIVLSRRLGELGRSITYGIASDDAHTYTRWGLGEINPGRGWIMVRSRRLTPDYITAAIKRGDFYASTGVELSELTRSGRTLSLEIDAEAGVSYTIEFIGTRRGTDMTPKGAVAPADGLGGRTGYRYGSDIGKVLFRAEGTRAEYVLRGDEIYVRARVTSSKTKSNPAYAGDFEMAWTQPLVASAQASAAVPVTPSALEKSGREPRRGFPVSPRRAATTP